MREARSAVALYLQAMAADGTFIRRPPPSPAVPAGKSAILRGQYSRTYDIGDHMGTVACPSLQPHIFYVALNRTGRDVELHRHLFGGEAECDKAEYLGFSVRQFNRGISIVLHGYPQSMHYLNIHHETQVICAVHGRELHDNTSMQTTGSLVQ